MRPPLIQDVNFKAKQFNNIEVVVENILKNKGQIAHDCQVIQGADFNTNLDGDTFRDAANINSKSRSKLLSQNAKVEDEAAICKRKYKSL